MPMMMPGNDPMTKKSRELYIGNLPDNVPEQQLMSFLNAALLQAGLNMSPGMPITSVRCNGRFAFAEFRSAEETTNAMNLNGIIIVGQSLNVGRPSAYTGPATQHVRWEQLMAERIAKHPELKDTAIGMPGPGGAPGGPQAPAGGAGPDPSTKICRELYIGNMPEGVNEGKLIQFFNDEMGRRQFNEPGAPGGPCIQARINGRFAFVEFRSIPETDRALTLNGSMFQGCTLRVGRPKAYNGPPGSAQMENQRMLSTAGLNLAATGGNATCAIQMSNMLEIDELRTEYDDILEDIVGEMEKYGEVEKCEIPRPPPEGEEVPDYVTMIFVKYKEVGSAIKAQVELEGRTFGGKAVACNFFPEDLFDKGEWCDIVKKSKPVLSAIPEHDAGMLPANLLGGPDIPASANALTM